MSSSATPFPWSDRSDLAPPNPTAEDLSRLVRRAFGMRRYRPKPLPQAAMQLMAMTSSKDVDFVEIAKVVASDMTLSAEIVRVANGALYARGEPVSTIEQAVNRLGFSGLREVASQAALRVAMVPHQDYRQAFDVIQRHAVATANMTHLVLEHTGRRDGNAYLAALFHDVGFSATMLLIGDVYGEEPPDLGQLWPELDRIHEQVGWQMARMWEIPDPLPDLIRGHHQTPRGRTAGTAAVVTISEHLACETGARIELEVDGKRMVQDAVGAADLEVALAFLNLDGRDLDRLEEAAASSDPM